nr:acyloxyacyl hydrolase [Rhizobium sullae]
MLRSLSILLASMIADVSDVSASAHAEDRIFDELRFGASASVQSGGEREDGVFPEVTIFFDPFGSDSAADWTQKLIRPRIHLGTSIGTGGEATQVFSGFSWTADFNDKLFAEAGFGGLIHTGNLDDEDDRPALGCRLLFHEYIGVGYRFDTHWNVMAQVAHSSHANLCDGPNDGMTRAGVQIGYKF